MEDEERRLPKEAEMFPRKLDDLSIDALRDYVAELQAEIERVRGEIESKEGHKTQADSFFRS